MKRRNAPGGPGRPLRARLNVASATAMLDGRLDELEAAVGGVDLDVVSALEPRLDALERDVGRVLQLLHVIAAALTPPAPPPAKG
jgi:hypothetical protein